ncbi:MAG: helix-turn-helix domain-containing protein [Terrimesophilobacter sp.]
MSVTVSTPALGLRERKRAATHRAIQHAVLRLATERGYEHVTIEEIAAAANISPRTFFNYFVSKDEAVVGEFPAIASLDAAEQFLAEGPDANIVKGLGRLLEAAAVALASDREASQQRRMLLRQHPVLLAKRMTYLHTFENELSELVLARLTRDNPQGAVDSEELEQQAGLLSQIVLAAMRFAYRRWIEKEGPQSLADRIGEAFQKLDAVLAIHTAR